MKKFVHTPLLIGLVLAVALAVAGIVVAEANKMVELESPIEPVLSKSETLSWKPVDRAEQYSVSVNGSLYVTTETSMDLFGILDAYGDYEIKVRADGDKKKTMNSVWSESVKYTLEDLSEQLTYYEYEPGLFRVSPASEELLSGKAIIPKTVVGGFVNQIGSGFYRCENLWGVLFSASVSGMLENSFRGENLLAVGTKSKTEVISANAFAGCANLEKVYVPEDHDLYYTEEGALVEKESKKLLVGTVSGYMPEGIAVIGLQAFNGRNVTEANVPASVKMIEDFAFRNCEKLASLSFEPGVTEIKNGAFNFCEALTVVTLPEKLTKVASVFDGCNALEELHLPSTLTEWEVGSLATCTALKTLTVEESNAVFMAKNTCLIKKGTDTNMLIEGASYDNIPADAKITSIGDSAFSFCQNGGETLTIPVGVIDIRPYAFRGCTNIKTVHMPATVKRIDRGAFEGTVCSVTLGPNASVGRDAFSVNNTIYSESDGLQSNWILTDVTDESGAI
ncbi:MAG: leucine-rich repeat domain-containing protein, partial [Clostridia bacterium]|nr:leucine-rich repeat domain-containing protein [Clostridia bacterium]